MCVQTVGADRRFCSGDPDIFVSTDFMPNYTSLIFSVPKNKSGLFNKTQPKDETALSMSAWVGDFSQERDEDIELPDAACHVDFYLTAPYGGQDVCTIETFVEDSEKDCSPIIKESRRRRTAKHLIYSVFFHQVEQICAVVKLSGADIGHSEVDVFVTFQSGVRFKEHGYAAFSSFVKSDVKRFSHESLTLILLADHQHSNENIGFLLLL